MQSSNDLPFCFILKRTQEILLEFKVRLLLDLIASLIIYLVVEVVDLSSAAILELLAMWKIKKIHIG